MKIAVIGRGVVGLSSAIRLQEHDYSVQIFSRHESDETTSSSAGAYWWPYKVYPKYRVLKWAKETYDELKELSNQEKTGVKFQPHLRFCIIPDESEYSLELVDEWQEIDGRKYGVKCEKAYRVVVPLIEVPRYMPYLENRFLRAGGNIELREIDCIDELFPDFRVVINCPGVWAKKLVSDDQVYPIRGQIVKVRSSENLEESIRLVDDSSSPTLILPRTDDCVLGGTAEEGNWSLDIDEDVSEDILMRCSKVVPLLKNAEIVGQSVGLRPGRKEIRLELKEAAPGQPVVHNYGHGGGGFTVAWGCANEVVELVNSYLNE